MNSTVEISKTKSLFDFIYGADLVVQLVILILFISSLWSWAIISNKYSLLKKTGRSISVFHRNMESLTKEGLENFLKSQSEAFFVFLYSIFLAIKSRENRIMVDGQVLESTILAYKENYMAKLEKGTEFLALISSSATFIGLFGTVWGIMHSFQSIANAHNASLVTVAPGIAEALFATALGLVVAIPAMIAHNIISSKIAEIEHQTNVIIHKVNILQAE